MALLLSGAIASAVAPGVASTVSAPIACPPALAALEVGCEIEGWRSTHSFTAKRLSNRPATFLLKNFLDHHKATSPPFRAKSHVTNEETKTRGLQKIDFARNRFANLF